MQQDNFSYQALKLTNLVQQQIDREITPYRGQSIHQTATMIHQFESSKHLRVDNRIEEEEPESPELKTTEKIGFKLVVSDSSSDASLSMSPLARKPPLRGQPKIKQMDSVRPNDEDQTKAVQNLKTIMRKKQETTVKAALLLSPKLGMQKSLHRPEEITKEKPEKRQINFLKSLNQNQNLKETSAIEEYYLDGKIIVNMHSKDLLTFVRLQHEVDELKRKQEDFNEQKERHFNLAKREQEQVTMKQKEQQKKSHEAWWVGISLAKRFLRKGRKARTQETSTVRFKETAIVREPPISQMTRSSRVSTSQNQLVVK